MHALNLGVLYVCNGASLLLSCKHCVQFWVVQKCLGNSENKLLVGYS